MMIRIIKYIKSQWLILAGGATGAIGGYLYWYFIGCSSGTCPITSSPLNSTLYGILMGGLLFSIFKKENKKVKLKEEDYFNQKAGNWDSPMKSEMAKKFVAEMLKNINLDNEKKVLDYGCGTGLVGMEVAHLVKSLVFLDSSPAMVNVLEDKLGKAFEKQKLSSKNIKVITGDINKYTTKDIDVVFSLMALHHVEDVQRVLEHISTNILKSSGLLVIGDLREENGSFHGDEKVPHNGFDIENLARQIEFSEMEVITTNTYNTIQKNGNEYEQFIIIAKNNK